MALTSRDLPGLPADLADDLDTWTARIADLQTQAAAIHAELATLSANRRALLDLYAEQNDDRLTLFTLRSRSAVAFQKVEADLRSIHPNLYSLVEFLPEHLEGPDEPVMEVGPHVSLMRHSSRPAPTEADLAAALIEFATRYDIQPPATGAHPGFIYADLLTENDDRPGLWYRPDGTEAIYYRTTGYDRTGYEPRTGTLAEVLTYALKDAQEPARHDDSYDW